MSKKSPGPAARAAARVNVEVPSIGVKPAPGESRIQEPAEPTVWDPSSESQETAPPADRATPAVDDTGKPAAAPTDEDKAARIRKILNGGGGEEQEEETTETEEEKPKADDKPAEPAKPPSRRDILAGLSAEKQKRVLENQLREERQKREDAERRAEAARRLATEGDILSIAKARGLTTDQAIDLLMNPPAEPRKPAPAAKPEDDTGERLSRLEQREREVIKREALSVLDEVTKDLDIPVVRATTRVAVADSAGRTQVMTGRELVLATAQRLWEADGKPAGDRRKYLAEAAPLVEQQLIDDDKERLEAYASKKNGGAKPASDGKPAPKPAPKKPPVPSVGTRSGGATEKHEPPALPDDPDERREAIKRRFGFTGG